MRTFPFVIFSHATDGSPVAIRPSNIDGYSGMIKDGRMKDDGAQTIIYLRPDKDGKSRKIGVREAPDEVFGKIENCLPDFFELVDELLDENKTLRNIIEAKK